MSEWLSLHDPFANSAPKDLLLNIASGLIADTHTNCDQAKKIGEASLSKMIGGYFGTVKLERKEKVIPISATNNTIKIREQSVSINPLQLFTRIAAVLK